VSDHSLLYARPLPSLTVPTYVFTEGVALDLLRLIEDGRLGRLLVVANAPAGRFQYQPVTSTLLPPDLPTVTRNPQRAEIRPPGDASALANHLLAEHFLVGLHRLVIASTVAEQLARIAAMRVATDNARRLLDRLGLESVIAERQAITSELLELAAGYELVRTDALG
jgi:F-type H+-transporting ATPase subunit gamma